MRMIAMNSTDTVTVPTRLVVMARISFSSTDSSSLVPLFSRA